MNLQDITSLITKAASVIESSEKIALPVLAAKARREAQAHPTDVPLINASNILTKMASDKMFISRSELANIVERLGATHSKLTQVFSDELGKQAEIKRPTFARYANEGQSLEVDYKRLADPLLANALSSVFDKDPKEKLYTTEDAQKAQRAAYAQLVGIGCVPKEVSTFAGRRDVIICQATHETPIGNAHVLIPVEMIEGKAILPQLFFSPDGFQEFDKAAYEETVCTVAGKGFRVDGSKLLDVLEQVKKGESGINEVELAAIKIASEQGTISSDPNAIYYGSLIEPKADVELPQMPKTPESKFAETLGKPEGVAKFIHGQKAVEAGRNIIVRKLAEIGYKNVQVKVAEVEQDKIYYAAAIGTGTGLSIPVDVEGGNITSAPQVVIADGMVMAFTKESVNEIVSMRNGGNKRALAAASPCYDLKPTELLAVVEQAVKEGNYLKVEEAINVLGEIDPIAQKVAIAHFMDNIYLPGQSPSEEMAAQRKIAKPVLDTPQFMTHKIFFPEGA